jgi:hypothetical protein
MVPGIAVQRLSGLAEPAGFLFDRKLRPPRVTVSLAVHDKAAAPPRGLRRQQGTSMARSLSIVGFLALAVGLLWIGQGTGAIRWPPSSFMINQLPWAGYGALLGAVGLILIWQGNR